MAPFSQYYFIFFSLQSVTVRLTQSILNVCWWCNGLIKLIFLCCMLTFLKEKTEIISLYVEPITKLHQSVRNAFIKCSSFINGHLLQNFDCHEFFYCQFLSIHHMSGAIRIRFIPWNRILKCQQALYASNELLNTVH